MESAAIEKGERIGLRQCADESLREWPPTSDAGEVGGKAAFTQVSTGSKRVIQAPSVLQGMMRRWRLQVVKNVRGSAPPLFVLPSKISTVARRFAATSG